MAFSTMQLAQQSDARRWLAHRMGEPSAKL